MQGIWSHKIEKGSRIVKLDMVSEKNMRMEEIGNGQQEMQEKIARRTKVVMNLTKGKGITKVPVYKKSLHRGKMAAVHSLCQIGMTFLNENN